MDMSTARLWATKQTQAERPSLKETILEDPKFCFICGTGGRDWVREEEKARR
jgi:hypothetical protein